MGWQTLAQHEMPIVRFRVELPPRNKNIEAASVLDHYNRLVREKNLTFVSDRAGQDFKEVAWDALPRSISQCLAINAHFTSTSVELLLQLQSCGTWLARMSSKRSRLIYKSVFWARLSFVSNYYNMETPQLSWTCDRIFTFKPSLEQLCTFWFVQP